MIAEETVLLRCIVTIPLLLCHQLALAQQTSAGDTTLLNEAPQAEVNETVGVSRFATSAAAVSSSVVDVYSRESVTNYFNNIYNSPGVAHQWTGSVENCIAGSVSSEFREAIKARINYFREMAGVLPITELRKNTSVFTLSDSSGIREPAETALMMSAEGNLSHYPEQPWECYSEAGRAGAAVSNLALGSFGRDAITQYMLDSGSNNQSVGHRRWILYPPIIEMDSGDIPGGAGASPGNALQVIGVPTDMSRPSRESFVAWPNPGYVPGSLVFPRWSFSLAEADFGNTNLTVYRNGELIDTTIESTDTGAGLNSVVWIPAEGADADKDTLYTVQLDNVLVNGVSQSHTYETVALPDAQQVSMDADQDGVYTGKFLETALAKTNSYWFIQPDSPLAQTFTRTVPGKLVGVNVPLYCEDLTSSITLEIRDVVGAKPGSVVHATSTLNAADFQTRSGDWQSFVFDTPLDLGAGAQYSVLIKSDRNCGWFAANEDYPEGVGYFAAEDFPTVLQDDLAIQVVVLPDQIDNCPAVANADQADYDLDNWGDACDLEVVLENEVWQMVSLPAVPPPNADSLSDILLDDLPSGTAYAVFSYDVASGLYIKLTAQDEMVPGVGYWAIQASGETVRVDMPVGSSPMSYEPTMRCSTALNCSPHTFENVGPVWDMFGPAVSEPVSHNDLRVSSTSGTCADIDACTMGEVGTAGADLLHPVLFNYNGDDYDEVVDGGELLPWAAYWVRMLDSSEQLAPVLWVPH